MNKEERLKKTQPIVTYCMAATGVLLFAYTLTRACRLSITWDEAYSYLEFVRVGKAFTDEYDGMSANNHLLYTWLEIHFTNWLGTKEWVLRLPSLIAHILYLVYSAKLVKQLDHQWLAFSAFLIINLNPYLLDFFSLARGYGLSIGLMMVSIYYLHAFHKAFKNKFAIVSVFFACLAVLANYVLLNYCLSLMAVLLLLQAYHLSMEAKLKWGLFIRKMLAPLLIFSVLLAIVVPIGLQLRQAQALFFGGKEGFWKDTVMTIISRSLYELHGDSLLLPLIGGFAVLVSLLAVIFASFQFFEKKRAAGLLFLITSILLLAIAATSTVAQHYLMGTLYLQDRTALFLFVLFAVMFVFFVDELSVERKKLAILGYIPALAISIHFIQAFNLNYSLEWKPDANTREMLADLEQIKEVPREKENISISIPLLFETGINFYRDVNNLTWLNPATRTKSRSRLYDYYYLSQKELAELNPDSIEILKVYPLTENVLARPRFKFNQIHVTESDALKLESDVKEPYEISPSVEYGKTISYTINDSVTPVKNAVIAFKALVKASTVKENDIILVIALQQGPACYSWQGVNVRDYVKKDDEWATVYFSCMVPAETKTNDQLKIYFWNRNKQQLAVKEMHFKWINYQ